MNKHLAVEVVYATPFRQWCISLKVMEGSTLLAAIQQSQICELCPEIDLSRQQVGAFGAVRPLLAPVAEGDRIEIYRPLSCGPKEARRAKAKQSQNLKKAR